MTLISCPCVIQVLYLRKSLHDHGFRLNACHHSWQKTAPLLTWLSTDRIFCQIKYISLSLRMRTPGILVTHLRTKLNLVRFTRRHLFCECFPWKHTCHGFLHFLAGAAQTDNRRRFKERNDVDDQERWWSPTRYPLPSVSVLTPAPHIDR